MKRIILLLAVLAGPFTQWAIAAVVQVPGRISVSGVIDGGLIGTNDPGDTLDYLKFELLSTSSITVNGSDLYGRNQLLLAAFIGRDDEFGFVGSPYLLEIPPGAPVGTPAPSFSRNLNAGIYVIALGQNHHTSYDIFDGFVPVNPEGGGFIFSNYAYEILGDVRALEFWDGNLDGTFTITDLRVPEPDACLLFLCSAAGLCCLRRRAA